MKTRPVGACCSMWTDGHTDMTKLIVALRDFTKAPINCAVSNFRSVCILPPSCKFTKAKTVYLSITKSESRKCCIGLSTAH